MGLTNNLGKLSNMITSTGSAVGIGTSSPKTYASLTNNGQLINLNNIGIDVGQSYRFNNYYNSGTGTDRTISTGYTGSIALDNAGGGIIFNTNSSSIAADKNVTNTEKMRITSGGRVGIGTTTPSQTLHVYNSASSSAAIFQGSSNSYIQLGVTNESYIGHVSGALLFEAGGSERMRITSDGRFLVRTSSAFSPGGVVGVSNMLNPNDNGEWALALQNNATTNTYGRGLGIKFTTDFNNSSNEVIFFIGNNTPRFIVNSNGNVVNSNGSYGTISSDFRLKENIVEATSKLKDLLKLRVVNFNLKEDENKKKNIGFIAQEFREIFPSLVYEKDTRVYDEKGNVIKGLEDSLGLSVGMEFAILVKAIQELNQQNQDLKSRLDKAGL